MELIMQNYPWKKAPDYPPQGSVCLCEGPDGISIMRFHCMWYDEDHAISKGLETVKRWIVIKEREKEREVDFCCDSMRNYQKQGDILINPFDGDYEIRGKPSTDGDDGVIVINFCPFCGEGIEGLSR